ncbi:hypothetical protein ACQPZP_05220 [Spirillospora sp. CA-142024]|uniref:hypothetical protein n=1 Tax=Spirillospora sp. CA-142024 TaxID=3240036 RepID=UPI003D8EA345
MEINCGPGDDPAILMMRNEVCMYPDPEDEAINRLLDQLGRQMQSSPPVVPVVPSISPIVPPGGGTMCADGTWSSSTGRGTCSWHGGQAH